MSPTTIVRIKRLQGMNVLFILLVMNMKTGIMIVNMSLKKKLL